jgi:hypothetical protein
MASSKTKNAIKQPIQKAFESRKSGELLSEIEDMRLGMEKRKFSYTLQFREKKEDLRRKKIQTDFTMLK